MNTTDKVWLVIIMLSISILTVNFTNKADIARLEKYDKCLANLIEKNPNEVEAREAQLKECMDR